MPSKIIYTNEQMRGDLQEIIRQMTASGFKADVVVGIARGGLVPATMLSHYLGKPLMTINTSLRDHMVGNSHAGDVQAVWQMISEGKAVLIVDDICDSGDTLRKVIDELDVDMMPHHFEGMCKVAVLWNNTAQDIFEADYVGREIEQGR